MGARLPEWLGNCGLGPSGAEGVVISDGMNIRRCFAIVALGLGLPALWGCEGSPPDAHASRPNIIYILADDMGFGDLGVNNPDSKIPTPNLDTLAAEGMRFTDAHSPASVCTPTRYGILTGEYAWRSKRLKSGVLRGYGHAMIETGRMTVASLLKDAGYETGIVGKWHLGLDWQIKPAYQEQFDALLPDPDGHMVVKETDPAWIDFAQPPKGGPLTLGFDYSYILPASLDMPPYAYLENDVLVEMPTEWVEGNDLDTGFTEAFWRAGHKAPGFIFDQVLPTIVSKSISFIENKAVGEKPYFLYVPLTGPHTPWLPTEAFENKSNAGNYGDFVNMIDDAVGRILGAVEASGQEGSTLVIFTSDNGPFWQPRHIAEYGHRAAGVYRGMKADIFEGGHRIPFVVKWPDQVLKNSVTDHLTAQTNLLATLAEIVGVAIPAGAAKDSVSILPVLLGNGRSGEIEDEVVVHQSSRNLLAIREGDWKFVDGLGSGGFTQPRFVEPTPGEPAGQLYNLARDPAETRNLYLEHPEIVTRLKRLLEDQTGNSTSR